MVEGLLQAPPPSDPVSGCNNPSTTTDPYLSTSYDSCGASDSDITGLWILVSDYSIIGSNAERNEQQRSMMVVTDHSDGTLNARVCNRDEGLQNFRFSSGASGLTIYDDDANAEIDLSITRWLSENSRVMMGTLSLHFVKEDCFIAS